VNLPGFDTRHRVASAATFALLVGASVVPVGACSSSPDAVAIGDDDASTDSSTDTMASDAADVDVGSLIPPDASDAHADGSSDGSTMDASVTCDSSTQIVCGGECVDPSDPAHCGSCTACPTTANGTATCAMAADGGAYACGEACGTGYYQCGTSCLAESDEPSDTSDTCIVSEAFGVFVSSTMGSDATGCGTRAAPCKTISNGITVAHAMSKRTYVCDDGTYAEQINLTTAVDGAAVYGGFSCTGGTWAYDATKKPLVMLSAPTGAASCASCALIATGLTTGAKFEDMAFQAPDGVNPGDSSIAIFANNSTGTLTFLRSNITAGNGVGWTTAAGTGSNYTGMTAQSGGAPTTLGGPKGSATCADGTASAGGNGGDGNVVSENAGYGGWSPTSTSMAGYDGLGGHGGTTTCAQGDPGSNGAGGAAGSASTNSGTLDASGWHAVVGNAGTNGNPGQGSGGGGGKTSTVPPIGGGGGGAGGCGGGSGAGGASGGSSIAVLSLSSSISLGMCTLTTGIGGSGQAGGAGESGQNGGGYANTMVNYCQGNYGGSGGGGGGGAGGAGGLSVGIVYQTTAPTMTSLNFTAGMPGAGGGVGAAGPAGTNGNGNPGYPGAAGNAGPAGVAQQTLALP
jgi:hypothetical protein